jgi:phage shock protein A
VSALEIEFTCVVPSQRPDASARLLRRMLESKLVEAKSKKDTLKARAKTAQTSRQIADMVQGLNTSNAVTAFERMEEKVMALEAEAESTLQVSACAHLRGSASQQEMLLSVLNSRC